MKRISKLTISTLLCLFLGIPLSSAQTQLVLPGVFKEAPCPFPLPEGLLLGTNFKFGYVSVPEFHEKPDGRTLQLAVAIFPSTNEEPRPDPIVMNTSGPGKSNMDNFIPEIAGGLGQYLLPERDIVIIELRGLRYSTPFLRSEEIRRANLSQIERNPGLEENKALLRKALHASKERFEKEGVDLSAFNNVETAADIVMVMKALGYDRFNMVGSSAGTLVAHHVIRDFPDHVRCAILDAGLPIDRGIFVNYVPNIVTALKRYFDECQLDPACAYAFPDLENRFLSALETLNEDPVILELEDPETKKPIPYVLNGYRLSSFVFFKMFYSTQIPLMLARILDGDYDEVKEFLQYSLQPDYFAGALGYVVFITESGDYSPEDIRIPSAYRTFADGITLAGVGAEYLQEVQNIWRLDLLDAEKLPYPRPYDVPVLVVNGAYDPVIPVKYDQVMKRSLMNCYIYRFDGVPHSAFDNATPCVLSMFLEFIGDPSKAPDSSCMDQYKQKYLISAGN